MIEHQTVLDQIEITRHDHVGIRIALLLVEDGKEIDCKWHRTSLTTDSDPILQMMAVNSDLQEMDPPRAPLPDTDLQKIRAHFDLFKAVNNV